MDVFGKKLFMTIACCFFLIATSSAYASYGTEHVFLGNFDNMGSTTTINIYQDSSVASYGYTTYVNNAKTGWDNASASLSFGTTANDDCEGCIAVYVGSDFLAPGYIGHCDYWSNDNFFGIWEEISISSVESGTDFERARVRLDDDHLDDAGANSTTNTMNAGHEIGHALSLAHFNNSPAHSGDHWMKTGLLNLSAPTTTDKAHLTYKWGP